MSVVSAPGMELAVLGERANISLEPTGLRPRKSAASRAFSEISSEGAHAAPARRVKQPLGGAGE